MEVDRKHHATIKQGQKFHLEHNNSVAIRLLEQSQSKQHMENNSRLHNMDNLEGTEQAYLSK